MIMPAVVIQNVFDGIVNRCGICQMLLDIPFPMDYVINDQCYTLILNLVDICLDNTLQISYKPMLCYAMFCQNSEN